MIQPQPGHGEKPFVISRSFPAPRARVWAAWTEPAQLRAWFGPTGTQISTCDLDLRPGGVFHYGMRVAGGAEMFGIWTFREIVAPERLVLVSSFSDAKRGIARHPMSPTWPRETLSTTTLSERAGATTLEIRWSPWQATPEEQRTFDAAHDGVTQGWGGTLDRLAQHLARS